MNTTLIRHTLVLRQQHLLEKLTELDLYQSNSRSTQLDNLTHITLRELAQVKQALHKLGSRGYGRCQSCGRAIEPERLNVLPCTEFCKSCASGH